ncbi:MAG: hypothetical protein ACN2B6_09105 [Rickettsiales bacterium]
MFYTQHIDGCFSEKITKPINKTNYEASLNQLKSAHTQLKNGSNTLAQPLLDIVTATDDLKVMNELAEDIRKNFSHVVMVGAGGSGLSGKVFSGLKPAVNPTLHFLENIDPDAIDDMLARIDLPNTLFIVTSKSGTTAETLGHFYILLEATRQTIGNDVGAHFLVVTMPGDNPLRQSANEHGICVLDHPTDIGGRFSVFTYQGLLPAAIAGIDIAKIRGGAATIIEELKNTPHDEYAPAIGAALQYAFMEQGYPLSVMLPYAQRLRGLSAWYRQSWAESLGKDGKGTTPLRAVGSTDQHSQLQLYLDGPKDKFFNVITTKRAGTGQPFDVPDREDISYLSGKTAGDIMAAEQKATIETLMNNGCPVRLLTLDTLNEESIGALFMHFFLEIIFMSELLGVNAFDQPAVEESKQAARDYLQTGNL